MNGDCQGEKDLAVLGRDKAMPAETSKFEICIRQPPVSELPKHPLPQLAHRFPIHHAAFQQPAVRDQRSILVNRAHSMQIALHNYPPLIAGPPPHLHVPHKTPTEFRLWSMLEFSRYLRS